MDNIVFEKIWEDDCIFEIKVTATSKYVTAYQKFYIDEKRLSDISQRIVQYSKFFKEPCYVQTGEKKGNFTPAFSMNISNIDMSGHVKIEVDIEISDIEDRSHRCLYYIKTDLGSLEIFGKKIERLCHSKVGSKVWLHQIY